jgi:predicted DsbA family dithiol-disulfide isomerase
MTAPALSIDVFSDVVCPWCYLGKRRLAAALARLGDRAVEVRWRPFRLDATIPDGGIDRSEYITKKFGSVAAIEPAHQRLVEMGRQEGIDYRFDLITRSPNTIDAHRLVNWAMSAAEQDAIVERLFRAYFSEGKDVGDRTVLVALAAEAGMADDIAARLAGGEDRQEVTEEIDGAYRIGVTGVPCFVYNRRLAVMGAQSVEVLLDVVRQADAAAA